MARRRPPVDEEEHENHERWLITYADMITLLMVLFIVLFAMSQVDQTQVQRAQGGPRRRLRPVHLDAGRLLLDPRAARHVGRRADQPEPGRRRRPRDRRAQGAGGLRGASGPPTSGRTPTPPRRPTGCSPIEAEIIKALKAQGPRGRRRHRHRRPRPGCQPGLATRRVPGQPRRRCPDAGPAHRRHHRAGAAQDQRQARRSRATPTRRRAGRSTTPATGTSPRLAR